MLSWGTDFGTAYATNFGLYNDWSSRLVPFVPGNRSGYGTAYRTAYVTRYGGYYSQIRIANSPIYVPIAIPVGWTSKGMRRGVDPAFTTGSRRSGQG